MLDDQIIYPEGVFNEAGITQLIDYKLIQNEIYKKKTPKDRNHLGDADMDV